MREGFVPQFAIVALLRYRLQCSFAHWTSASPVSATGGGEAPSLSRFSLDSYLPPTNHRTSNAKMCDCSLPHVARGIKRTA